MSKKKTTKLEGIVTDISELIIIEKGPKYPKLRKRIISITLDDGQQLFPDLIDRKLNLLDIQKITTNTRVIVDIIFKGSVRDDRRYNNINIVHIQNVGQEIKY